ncbi:MAG: sigma-70 family RNA polymerase sigma factor [Planctomycetaceae bacterium]|nr:MAG: sigma-70 family RNA polymerase sigma factor [Planctomycetaceae bacterium]
MSSETVTYTIEDSDELLLTQYGRTGERKLFETLMRRYESEIYSYLRRYLGREDLAEDAFQGTFLQVHLKVATFDSARRFRPWLYAIATNQAIDVQRKCRRRRMVSLDHSYVDRDQHPTSWADQLVSETPDPAAQVEGRENNLRVQEAVAGLGESMERVIQLVYFQGLKYREAAEILGIPVGTVKSRVHAAIARLGTVWRDAAAEPVSES